MFKIWHGNVDHVVQFPNDAEVVHDLVRLLDERFVDVEGFRGVGFGHFEIVFW